MSPAQAIPPMTLWLWPLGLYPRRLAFYLRAKFPSGIPSSINLKVIHCSINPTTGQFEAPAGVEDRPVGCSFPVLRVGDEGSGTLVKQASPMLEFLEDTFESIDEGDGQGWRTMRPSTALGRAKMRDVVNMINEVVDIFNIVARHGFKSALQWSGLTREQMIPLAAHDALNMVHQRLTKLDGWVEGDIEAGKWLAGTEHPGIADCNMVAFVVYVEYVYGMDLCAAHDGLRKWYENYKEHASFKEDPGMPEGMRHGEEDRTF